MELSQEMTVLWIYFLVRTIIPIWEHGGEVWRFMDRLDSSEASTILKILRLEQNLNAM